MRPCSECVRRNVTWFQHVKITKGGSENHGRLHWVCVNVVVWVLCFLPYFVVDFWFMQSPIFSFWMESMQD